MQAAHKFQEMAHLGRIVRTATDPLIRQDNAGRAQYTFPPSDRTGVCRKLCGMGNGTSLHPYVTFITKDIKENGIYEAMKQLNLLSLS